MVAAGSLVHSIVKVKGNTFRPQDDIIAAEEPLQVQVKFHRHDETVTKNIAVTMRTPGCDKELAAGFLFTEGIIKDHNHIASILSVDNNIIVELIKDIEPSLQKSDRNFYTTSSCGVCGKTSIEAVKMLSSFNERVRFTVSIGTLYSLKGQLAAQQQLFETTGGLHAAALFETDGTFIQLMEDVGRHNAVDKLIGNAFLNGNLPLYDKILLLSGRAGFELVQKAAMAGIKMIVALGAPSSLAVQLAKENDITLVGFLRDGSMNIYCNEQRIIE